MADDADARPDRAVASSAVSPLADLDLWLLFAVTLVGVGNVSSVSPAFPQPWTCSTSRGCRWAGW